MKVCNSMEQSAARLREMRLVLDSGEITEQSTLSFQFCLLGIRSVGSFLIKAPFRDYTTAMQNESEKYRLASPG